MKYKDFKTMPKQEMLLVKGGNEPFYRNSIVGSTFYNGVCKVDVRICNSSGQCNDLCNFATAIDATTPEACSAMVTSQC